MPRGIHASGALVLAACFSKPAPPSVVRDGGPGSDSGDERDAIDGAPGDGSPSACGLTLLVDEPFSDPGGTACGTWGTASGATPVWTNDQLAVTAPAGGNSESHCVTAAYTLTGIVALELASLPDIADGDYQFLEIRVPSTANSAYVQIYRSAGTRQLSFSCGALSVTGVPYSDTDRWVRMTVIDQGSAIAIEAATSSNGIDVNRALGMCVFSGMPPLNGTVRFGAGADGAQPSPATAYFDNFKIACQ